MTPSEFAALQSRLDKFEAVAEERNTTVLKRFDGFDESIRRIHDRVDKIDERTIHVESEISQAHQRLIAVESWQESASELIELMRDIKERLSLKYLGTVVVLIGGMVTLLNVVIGWFR